MSDSNLVSVVIRTFNEQKHLPELLAGIRSQVTPGLEVEVVIVDSGSTDDTVRIANQFGCRITTISQEEFTFGRSLNVGCDFARGEYLVFVSGHCIPCDDAWLRELVEPLRQGLVAYVYGKQVGRDSTKFSEEQVFRKYYPDENRLPQDGFYCNNANAALLKEAWRNFRFNESLTGLEDMYLAKQLVVSGRRVGYVSRAAVFHIHDESWRQVQLRYEREAIALREIMPEVHMSVFDLVRCVCESIFQDLGVARSRQRLTAEWLNIYRFRWRQYWGAYRGHHEHRKLSMLKKRKYFYPNEDVAEPETEYEHSSSRPAKG